MKIERMALLCVVAAGICWGIIGLFTRQLSAYGLSPLQITFWPFPGDGCRHDRPHPLPVSGETAHCLA